MQKNIAGMLADIGNKTHKSDIEKYKQQATIVEDKIKQITSERDWASVQKIEEKISLNEAILQRDIAASERDALKKQMNAMEDIIDELREAEIDVLEKVSKISLNFWKFLKKHFLIIIFFNTFINRINN